MKLLNQPSPTGRAPRIAALTFARAMLLLATSLCCLPTVADPSREHQLKAAFIYNFVQFIEWPADALGAKNAPIVIGIMGDDTFRAVLEQTVAGKSINGRSLTIRRVAANNDSDGCSVLYVAASEDASLEHLMKDLKGRSVLTIGESDNFEPAGGAIRFYTEDNKMRFEVNLEAAKAAKLTVSSKLLKLARIYKK